MKYLKHLLLLVLMLMGSVSFTACSEEDEANASMPESFYGSWKKGSNETIEITRRGTLNWDFNDGEDPESYNYAYDAENQTINFGHDVEQFSWIVLSYSDTEMKINCTREGNFTLTKINR